jgi:hypothetical protein
MPRVKQTSPSAFSSVFVLCLMVLMLSLLLPLINITRIETHVAQSHQTRELAKQNALAGLKIALGTLQKYAGPDQRITARADILALPDKKTPNQYWTGVWKLKNKTQVIFEHWLVSGKTPNINRPLKNPIPLLNTNPNHPQKTQQVRAEKVPILSVSSQNKSQPIGHYAFWIADESIKASIGITDKILDHIQNKDISPEEKTQKEFLRQMMAHRTGTNHILSTNDPLEPFDPDHIDNAENLKKTISLSQLPLVNNDLDRNFIQKSFHDITLCSLGLLISPKYGMKKDLGLNPHLWGGKDFAAYMNYTQYMVDPKQDPNSTLRSDVSDLKRRYSITAPNLNTTRQGEVLHSVAPILTEFIMLINVSKVSSGNRLRIRYKLYVELWNPYTSALVPEDLEIVIRGLPIVHLNREDGIIVDVDIQKELANDSNNALVITLPFEEIGIGNDDISWLPGRIYGWVGPNNSSNGTPKTLDNSHQGIFYKRNVDSAIWEELVHDSITYPSPLTKKFILCVNEPTRLSIKLRQTNKNGGNLLASFGMNGNSWEFNPFCSEKKNSSSTGPQFGYRFQLFEPEDIQSTNPWKHSVWLRTHDPRNPEPTPLGKRQSTPAYVLPDENSPVDYTSTKIDYPERLFNRSLNRGIEGGSYMEDIPLFELPRQSHVSLGALQHLHIIGQPPYCVGNSWNKSQKAGNDVFDRFFFSGLTQHSTLDDLNHSPYPLPNSRLRFIQTKNNTPVSLETILRADAESAPLYLVEGAFNINSTSVKAWEAVLGSITLKNWEYVDLDSVTGDQTGIKTRETLPNAFFRFSQSIQETYKTGYQNEFEEDEEEPHTEFYRVGLKTLTDEELQKLAQAIVHNIRLKTAHSGPFPSLEEFLKADPLYKKYNQETEPISLLESAIGSVKEINTADPQDFLPEKNDLKHHTPIPIRAPNYLTQADILTALAPILTVRSDTFLIRSYGDSINKTTGKVESKIWCEALVQRFPDLVDQTDNPVLTATNGVGRRFKVIQFRWLDAP